MISIIKLISRLPLPVLHLLSFKLYILMYYLIGYRKKVVLSNLRNSFPDKSEKEIQAIAKKFYFRFADYIVETLKGITISKQELTKRVKVKNFEVIEPYIADKQTIIFLVSHQFNWEWTLLFNSIIMPVQVDGLYKKLSHPAFEKLILEARGRFGAHMIEKDSSVREIVRRKSIQRVIAIVADQIPILHSPAEKYWTTFMKQDTAFYAGGERIAKMIKAPVFFLNITAPKRGYYDIEFVHLVDPPYDKKGHEILESYVKATEKLIHKEPEGWLWTHKRWKYSQEEDRNR
ncbi:MAG: lysophospholipid acyltransferase family protein [Flammeovirgaceae bacterium]